MNSYLFETDIFDDVLQSVEDKTLDPLYTVGFSKGNPGELKQLDPKYVPIDARFFQDQDGVLVLDIGALKEALDNYTPGPK